MPLDAFGSPLLDTHETEPVAGQVVAMLSDAGTPGEFAVHDVVDGADTLFLTERQPETVQTELERSRVCADTEGVTCFAHADMRDAISYLKSEAPDVVVCDLLAGSYATGAIDKKLPTVTEDLAAAAAAADAFVLVVLPTAHTSVTETARQGILRQADTIVRFLTGHNENQLEFSFAITHSRRNHMMSRYRPVDIAPDGELTIDMSRDIG